MPPIRKFSMIEDDDTPDQTTEALIQPADVNKLYGNARSDSQGLSQTALHGGLIALTTLLLRTALRFQESRSGWLPALAVLAALLLQGLTIVFLFAPLHESLHGTVFRTDRLNYVLAWVTGFLTMRPPRHYKYYHNAHHRFTGDPKRDPELADSWIDPQINSYKTYVFYLTGLPFWVDASYTTLSHALATSRNLPRESYLVSDRSRRYVMWEARLFLALYALLFFGSLAFRSTLLWHYWILPSILSQGFLRYYLLAEHAACATGADMIQNTRTTATVWLFQKLTWNMPFHQEHHAWPQVPFHALPQLHTQLQQKKAELAQLGQQGCEGGEKGYLAFHKGFLLWLANQKRKLQV